MRRVSRVLHLRGSRTPDNVECPWILLEQFFGYEGQIAGLLVGWDRESLENASVLASLNAGPSERRCG